MAAVVFQFIPVIRRASNYKLHRFLGRLNITSAIFTCIGGISWIVVNRFNTVGGVNMTLAFSCYGIWFFITAVFTLYYVRYQRNIQRHKAWALRFFAMCLSSMIYRMWLIALEPLFGFRVTDPMIGDHYLEAITAWVFFVGTG
eukprot:161018_1